MKMPKENAQDKILKRIKTRYQQATDAEAEQRAKSLNALKFCDIDNQWPDDIKRERQASNRPCLTIDKTTPFIKQVVNQQRANRPEIKVQPVDSGSDIKTAEVFQGLIRSIIQESKGDLAFDTAFESAVRGGFGYIRVVTEYEGDDSFDQTLKIKSIIDPFKVYVDPSYEMPDGSDIQWAIVEQDMTHEEYKEQYPETDLSRLTPEQWMSIGDDAPDWIAKDGQACRVVEYFEKVRKPKKIHRLEDGTVTKELPEGMVPMDTRTVYEYEIKWYKVNGAEILDEGVFPGSRIPIVPVFGDVLLYEGKRSYSSLVMQLMDVARSYNYMKTAQVEAIALSNKAPWVAPFEAVEDFEETWRRSNIENYAVLPYKAYTSDGNALPAPFRNVQEAPIQAITMAMQGIEGDLKSVTGMYDPSLGNRSESGQSGIAITRLQRQGEIGQYHFQDNLARALRVVGLILVECIPVVYDTPKVRRILGIDDKQQMVEVNSGRPQVDEKTGIAHIYDLNVGKYDVVTSVGPSFATQREQNAQIGMELLSKVPGLAQVAGDLVVKMLDFPLAEELAERITPPEFKKQKGNEPQIPPQIQQQMQALAQQHDQLVEALNEAQEQIKDKSADRESKERIEALKIEATIFGKLLDKGIVPAQSDLSQDMQMLVEKMGVDLEALQQPQGMPMMPPANQMALNAENQSQEQSAPVAGNVPEQPMQEVPANMLAPEVGEGEVNE